MRLPRRLLYRGGGTAVSRWDAVGAARMHSRVAAGAPGAPPVVLLHGFGVSSRYLMPTAVRLAPRRTAIAPDMPGTGRSSRRGMRTDLAGQVRLLVGWMDAVGLRRAPFVANSFGCQVLVELARRHPERVSAVVLVGPTVDRHARSVPRQVLGLALGAFREPLGLLALIALDYPPFLLRGGLREAETAVEDPLERRLAGVRAPALVVRGEHDTLVSPEWAEEVARGLPHGALRVVTGAAHAVNHSHGAELAALVADLLDTVEPARAG